jgi:hypothetical protein
MTILLVLFEKFSWDNHKRADAVTLIGPFIFPSYHHELAWLMGSQQAFA